PILVLAKLSLLEKPGEAFLCALLFCADAALDVQLECFDFILELLRRAYARRPEENDRVLDVFQSKLCRRVEVLSQDPKRSSCRRMEELCVVVRLAWAWDFWHIFCCRHCAHHETVVPIGSRMRIATPCSLWSWLPASRRMYASALALA